MTYKTEILIFRSKNKIITKEIMRNSYKISPPNRADAIT